MPTNPHKTATVTKKGIIISYQDVHKHWTIDFNEKDSIQKIQLFGKNSFQKKKEKGFNAFQAKLFNQIYFGYDAYSSTELKQMSAKDRLEIRFKYNKGQSIINHLKQETLFQTVDDFLISLFPHSKIVNKFSQVKPTKYILEDSPMLREIPLSKNLIAKKFVESKLLPANFFSLSIENKTKCNTSSLQTEFIN